MLRQRKYYYMSSEHNIISIGINNLIQGLILVFVLELVLVLVESDVNNMPMLVPFVIMQSAVG